MLLLGAYINARDEDGTTPLSCAFLTVKSASAKVLIKAGADVAARIIYGNESLHYAGNRSPDDLTSIDSLIQGVQILITRTKNTIQLSSMPSILIKRQRLLHDLSQVRLVFFQWHLLGCLHHVP